jgi:26S proteasome regulatory subunit T2
LKGQNQSGSGGAGQGDKKEDKVCKHVYVKQILIKLSDTAMGKICLIHLKDKRKKYEPPVPTRVGKKQKKLKGPEAANKLPQGMYNSFTKHHVFTT